MSELKACPFCDSKDLTLEEGFDASLVECGGCCALGSVSHHTPTHDSRADAAHLWNTRPEEDRLRSALQAAERERDEARSQVALMADSMNKASQLAHDVHMGLIKERDLLADAVTQYRDQRDAARLEAGRLAQELVEVKEKLALAEVEVGRLREALTTADDTLCDYINAHDEEAQGALLEDLEKTLSEALEPKEVTGG